MVESPIHNIYNGNMLKTKNITLLWNLKVKKVEHIIIGVKI